MKAEELGSHYESLLEKEVRKEGGIYYTPHSIVDYIVKHTVGKLIECQMPANTVELKIIDPACGGGAFLLGAYQCLLDRYEKHFGPLTLAQRGEILLRHIFGVDIDPAAVEVTKRALYLKLLENEPQAFREKAFQHFAAVSLRSLYPHPNLLPDLDSNIRCGNALVGNDYYVSKNRLQMDDKERCRVNVFDWHEAFPAVFRKDFMAADGRRQTAEKESDRRETAEKERGGFDCVIGNPPYSSAISDDLQEYFQNVYQHQNYQKDLYLLFLEKYADLLKEGGMLGVIVSNTWLLSVTTRKIRSYLTNQYCWKKIILLPVKTFKQAVVETHALIFEKTKPKKERETAAEESDRRKTAAENDSFAVETFADDEVRLLHRIPFSEISRNGLPINITAKPAHWKLYCRLQDSCDSLRTFCKVRSGVIPFEQGKGTPPQSETVVREKPFVHEGKRPDRSWSPFLRGRLIHRYENRWNHDYWILYGKHLAAPRDSALFDSPEKIMIRQTGDSLIAALVGKGFIAGKSLHIMINNSPLDIRFFLACINSTLLQFFYRQMNPEKRKAFAEVKKIHVEQLPIPKMDLTDTHQRQIHDRLVALADQMLSARKDLRNAPKTNPQQGDGSNKERPEGDGSNKERPEGDGSNKERLDKQIDLLVYQLYGLTEEEINIAEGNAAEPQ